MLELEPKYKPRACQHCGKKGMKIPIKKDVVVSFGYLFCKFCGSDHVYTVNRGRVEFDIEIKE